MRPVCVCARGGWNWKRRDRRRRMRWYGRRELTAICNLGTNGCVYVHHHTPPTPTWCCVMRYLCVCGWLRVLNTRCMCGDNLSVLLRQEHKRETFFSCILCVTLSYTTGASHQHIISIYYHTLKRRIKGIFNECLLDWRSRTCPDFECIMCKLFCYHETR